MAVGNPLSTRFQCPGIARTSSGIFHGVHADLYRRLLPLLPRGHQFPERIPYHFAGHFAGSGVHRPSGAVVWLALHGGATAATGPFSADRERPVAVAAVICPVDQPAWLLGLWPGRVGADHCSRPAARGWGSGGGAALVSSGTEKTSAGLGRIPGRALRQPFRLHAGALPIGFSFSSTD